MEKTNIRCMIENIKNHMIVSDWNERDIYFSDWKYLNTFCIKSNIFMEYYIHRKKDLMLSFIRGGI